MTTRKMLIETPEGYERVEAVKDGTTYISFEKIETKKTAEEYWKDVVKNYLTCKDIYWADIGNDIMKEVCVPGANPQSHKTAHLTSQRTEAFVILQALITARDYYNEGWVADWTDSSINKYVIESQLGKIDKDIYCTISKTLNFKTEAIRYKFYEDFKEWIEIVNKEGLI